MQLTRIPSIILLLVTHILIPISICIWLLIDGPVNIVDWGIRVLLLSVYSLFIFMVGYWGYLSYYLRNILIISSVIALLLSSLKIGSLPSVSFENQIALVLDCIELIILLVLGSALISASKSYSFRDKPIKLAFPFKNGTYSIIDGGDGKKSSLMNYHFKAGTHNGSGVNNSMRYATDITKLNHWLSSAQGILPADLKEYAIYEETLYSPCNGLIIDVIDQYPNNIPFSGNYPYNVGNCIVIQTSDIILVMGHLQKDSIKVSIGEEVTIGQIIGKMGNSGWTQQPHLHIQAMQGSIENYWLGRGVPILFDDIFPVKNKIFNV